MQVWSSADCRLGSAIRRVIVTAASEIDGEVLALGLRSLIGPSDSLLSLALADGIHDVQQLQKARLFWSHAGDVAEAALELLPDLVLLLKLVQMLGGLLLLLAFDSFVQLHEIVHDVLRDELLRLELELRLLRLIFELLAAPFLAI